MVKPQVEEGGLVETCIPWGRHHGRSRSWGSGGGEVRQHPETGLSCPPFGQVGFWHLSAA